MNHKNADDARRIGPQAGEIQRIPADPFRSELRSIAAGLLHVCGDDPAEDEKLRLAAVRLRDLADGAAPRASQADTGPHSTGCGSRTASDPGRGSAGRTEPRLREIFDDAFGEAPGGWEESVDAGIAAIRAAIADEIEAEEAKIDRRSSDQASWHSNGMIAAANLIRAGDQ